jgi:hypothetical protein
MALQGQMSQSEDNETWIDVVALNLWKRGRGDLATKGALEVCELDQCDGGRLRSLRWGALEAHRLT